MDKVFDKILSYEGNNDGKRYLVSPRTISEFFTEGNYILKIPDYQRPYSWTDKNIKDLLDDILKLSKKEDSSWFLGPVFTVRRSSETKYSELLDGQQRITTIQIILREATLLRFNWLDLDLDSSLKRKLKIVDELCNRCLVKMEGIHYKPVFETEPDMQCHFSKYIVKFQELETIEDLKFHRKEFEESTLKAQEEGSVTAKTILNSIKVIRKYLEETFTDNDNNVVKNMESFIDFVESLTTKCWLIEIPLQSHDDSIQIFESLNNRGKKLTLVDKLRFKSIIKSSKDNIDQIRLKWKDVYSGISFLIENSYVKSEDDFYKVFFNSIKGDNITKEDDFLVLFSNHYLNNDLSILEFLKETSRITDFYKTLYYSLDEDNAFVKYFDKKEQDKVKSLLQLLKSALEISDNSRLVLFSIIRTYSKQADDKYSIIQCIWNLIRRVFYTEIYRNKKSNVIRTEYMELVEQFTKDNTTLLKRATYECNRTILEIIKTKNNAEAKFVLMLYGYMYDYNSLCSHSPKQYSNSHLDHLFPQKWSTYWNDKQYTRDEVLDYLEELKNKQKELFAFINWEQFENDIKSLESFIELDKDRGLEDTLIEFIGNKWLLHSGTNIKTSHKGFDFKKSEYLDQKWIKVPSNSHILGIDNYDEFTYKEVILRTLLLANGIISKLNDNWDDI